MSATDLAAGYELAFSEARRGLDQQERLAGDLRTRAAAIIAAAAVAASFFGSGSAERGLPWSGWLAVGCFCLVGVAVLVVLWPSDSWRLEAAAPQIVDRFLEGRGEPARLPAIYRELIQDMEDTRDLNDRQLQLLTVSLRAASLLLLAEVAAWLVDVAVAAG